MPRPPLRDVDGLRKRTCEPGKQAPAPPLLCGWWRANAEGWGPTISDTCRWLPDPYRACPGGGYAGERQNSIRWAFVSQRCPKLQRASCPAGMWPSASEPALPSVLLSMNKVRDIDRLLPYAVVRGKPGHAGLTEAVPGRAGEARLQQSDGELREERADGAKPCVRPEEDSAGSWNCKGPNCPPTLNDWGAWRRAHSRARKR